MVSTGSSQKSSIQHIQWCLGVWHYDLGNRNTRFVSPTFQLMMTEENCWHVKGLTPYGALKSWMELDSYLRSGQRLEKPVHCDRELYNLMMQVRFSIYSIYWMNNFYVNHYFWVIKYDSFEKRKSVGSLIWINVHLLLTLKTFWILIIKSLLVVYIRNDFSIRGIDKPMLAKIFHWWTPIALVDRVGVFEVK